MMPELMHIFDAANSCGSVTDLYIVHGQDAWCRLRPQHTGPHMADISPDSRDNNIVSWGTPPTDDREEPIMSDSYFLRPDAGGPALEMRPGVHGRVLVSTVPGVSVPHVVLDQGHVEEVCQVMYRYAGLEWPGLTAVDAPCATQFRKGECAGTVGHPGDCTVNADDIPSVQERTDLEGHPEECHGEACYAAPPAGPSTTLMPEIRSVVRRIENLEQSTASGAAVDDMFVEQSRRIRSLEQRLDTMADAHDSNVQAQTRRIFGQQEESRTVVQLLTEIRDRMGHVGDEHARVLAEIRDRLPAPPPPVCGADNSAHGGDLNCELPVNHGERHAADNASWPDPDGWTPAKIHCHAASQHGERCLLPIGHPHWHSSGHHTWGQD